MPDSHRKPPLCAPRSVGEGSHMMFSIMVMSSGSCQSALARESAKLQMGYHEVLNGLHRRSDWQQALAADVETHTTTNGDQQFLQMHKECLSCLALHRRRKITSLDCAKVLTNYFRPLETAAGITSLCLCLPGGLRGSTVSMTGPLKERELLLWFVILSTFRLK